MAILLGSASELAAQQSLQVFPLGSEFRVNSYTTDRQSKVAIASDADGDFTIAWESYSQDGASEGIFAQRYASVGAAVGSEFRVNTYTTGEQRFPSVAADRDGDLVIVWEDSGQDGDFSGVFGQRYSSAGTPAGTEFRVNDATTSLQNDPSVAAAANGDFVVVWNNPDNPFYIMGRRFSSSGAALGGDFQINGFTGSDQYTPKVASDPDGPFMVVWHCQDATLERNTCGRRYDSGGQALGNEFVVNTYTTDEQYPAAVASDPQGNFVVVWRDTYYGVRGQRYSSAGAPRGSEFQVNTSTNVQESYPSVAADALGFVVTWHNLDQDGSDGGVFGRRFHSNGDALGGEFQVNTYTTGHQRYPATAADAQGDFVVVWEDEFDHDGDFFGVFAQRFAMAYEVDSQFVTAGNSFGTDTNDPGGTDNSDAVETTVRTSSGGLNGDVTIVERPRNTDAPAGFGFVGQQVIIEAPVGSVGVPVRITFELDASTRQSPSISVFRDGVLVPNCVGMVNTCVGVPGSPTVVNPAPACVSNRCLQTDGDIEITVLTISASTWDLVAPCIAGFAKGLLVVKDTPGAEKLIAKLIKGPPGVQEDFGNPLFAGGTPYRLRVYDDTGALAGQLGVSRAGETCSGGADDCWKAIGGVPPAGTGFKYKDDDQAADGISRVLFKANANGTKILFKAKGPAPPFPSGLPTALLGATSITLQVHNDDAVAASCFSVTLADIKTQLPDAFKAK